jgi:hypothetical protein
MGQLPHGWAAAVALNAGPTSEVNGNIHLADTILALNL